MSLQNLSNIRTLVVKVGSSLVTAGGKGIDQAALDRWAAQIAELGKQGVQTVLVSSGAIAEGIKRLGWSKRPTAINELQAAAAVGQTGIAQAYETAFAPHGIRTAQILLTHDDLRNRRRYLNARATLNELLRLGTLPVVNENDTVSVDELKLGDNDNLAATVAALIDADVLFIATDIDGLYSADPRRDPDAVPIHDVPELTSTVLAMAGGAGTGAGTGGMHTKLEAAAKAGRVGIETCLFNGRDADVVRALAQGRLFGTRIHAGQSREAARKYWLRHAPLEAGAIVVDEGAARALREKGASLLPGGVTTAEGEFRRGDMVQVRLRGEAGDVVLARGVSQYSASDIRRVAGRHSRDIEGVLGYNYGGNVIHRDDMVLV